MRFFNFLFILVFLSSCISDSSIQISLNNDEQNNIGERKLLLPGPRVDIGSVTHYKCYYDNIIDVSVTGSKSCSELSNTTFDSTTGGLSLSIDLAGSGEFEFKIIAVKSDLSEEAIYHNISIGVEGNTDVDMAPVISAISDQNTIENINLASISLIIDDDNTNLNCNSDIVVSSSNTSLIDIGNIVFSGTAPNCFVSLQPKVNQSGIATLEFTVTDGTQYATSTFDFEVYSIPRPAISSSESSPTSASPVPITINFSEDVSDFDLTDIIVAGGTKGNFSQVNPSQYTFDLTPSGDGNLTVDILAGVSSSINSVNNSAATQFSITYTAPGPGCTGTMVAGYCWFHDDTNASCDTVCTGKGGYHLATRFYAGSHGTQQQCDDVLKAIAHVENNYSAVGTFHEMGSDAGCATGNTDWEEWGTKPTLSNTTAGGVGSRRVCACGDGSAAIGSPNEIANLTATSNSTSEVLLAWDNGGGTTSDFVIAYQVGATAPADCSSAQVGHNIIEHVTESEVKHIVTGLSANTQYSFRVCASNGLGTPVLSDGLTVTSSTIATNVALQSNRPQFDSSSTDTITVASTVHGISHTVSGTNTLLVVMVRNYDYGSNLDITTMSANGRALTKLTDIQITLNWGDSQVWYLVNPDSGLNNISFNTVSNNQPYIVATSFTGVNQSTPFGTVYSEIESGLLSHRVIHSENTSQNQIILSVATSFQGISTIHTPIDGVTISNNTAFGRKFDVSYFGGMDTYNYSIDFDHKQYGYVLIPINPL